MESTHRTEEVTTVIQHVLEYVWCDVVCMYNTKTVHNQPHFFVGFRAIVSQPLRRRTHRHAFFSPPSMWNARFLKGHINQASEMVLKCGCYNYVFGREGRNEAWRRAHRSNYGQSEIAPAALKLWLRNNASRLRRSATQITDAPNFKLLAEKL